MLQPMQMWPVLWLYAERCPLHVRPASLDSPIACNARKFLRVRRWRQWE